MQESLFFISGMRPEEEQEAFDEAFRLLVHEIEVDLGSVGDQIPTIKNANFWQEPFGVSDLMVRQTIGAPDAKHRDATRRIETTEPQPTEYTNWPGSAPRPDRWTSGDEIVKID